MTPSEVLIVPASNLRGDFLPSCLSQVRPQIVIVTGSPPAELPLEISQPQETAWHFTHQGAVTVTVSSGKVHVSQWRP